MLWTLGGLWLLLVLGIVSGVFITLSIMLTDELHSWTGLGVVGIAAFVGAAILIIQWIGPAGGG